MMLISVRRLSVGACCTCMSHLTCLLLVLLLLLCLPFCPLCFSVAFLRRQP